MRYTEEQKIRRLQEEDIAEKKAILKNRKTLGNGKKTTTNDFFCDLKGHCIDPVPIDNLPTINPRCAVSPNKNTKKESMLTSLNQTVTAKEVSPSKSSAERKSMHGENRAADSPYDKLMPSVGVTFVEDGKTAKSGGLILSQKDSKYSLYLPTVFSTKSFLPPLLNYPPASTASGFDVNSSGCKDETISSALPKFTESNPNYSMMQSENSHKTYNANDSIKAVVATANNNTVAVDYDDLNPDRSYQQLSRSKSKLYSMCPNMRSTKNLTRNSCIGKSQDALSKMSLMIDMSSPLNARLAPISPKRKNKGIIVQQERLRYCVKYQKKFPRERFYNSVLKSRKVKLPPPPLGESLGHGIFKG